MRAQIYNLPGRHLFCLDDVRGRLVTTIVGTWTSLGKPVERARSTRWMGLSTTCEIARPVYGLVNNVAHHGEGLVRA